MRRVLVALACGACGRLAFEAPPADGPATLAPDAALPGADGAPADADLAAACGPAYQVVGGLTSRYRMGAGMAGWLAAQAACEADGGHLVTVDDAAERAHVQSRAPVETWIGYTDAAQEGAFVSVFGAAPAIPDFVSPEPNDDVGVEDCVEIRGVGWNDARCALARPYICECDGQPLPPTRPWCDTDLAATCGDCATACDPQQTCFNQVCQ